MAEASKAVRWFVFCVYFTSVVYILALAQFISMFFVTSVTVNKSSYILKVNHAGHHDTCVIYLGLKIDKLHF